MPTYEYICDKCGHHFDIFQSITSDPLGVCPKEQCAKSRWGRGKVRRALSGGAGLLFKGSGFYITDYRSENYKAAAKKESGGGTPSKDSGSGSGSTAGENKAASSSKKDSATSKPSASTTTQ